MEGIESRKPVRISAGAIMAEGGRGCPIPQKTRVLSARSEVDVLQETETDEAGEHARSPIGEERKRHTSHRHQPHRHPDIFECLECEPRDDTDGDESTEHILASPCDRKTSEDDDGVEQDDRT